MLILFKILIIIFLLYPALVGFIFNSRKPELKKRIIYGIISVLLAIFNMIVVVATYFGAFLSDSWFTFISFFVFQISLLVSVAVHIVMVIKSNYNAKFAKTMSIILLVSGVLFSLFLILFSRPEVTTGEGITVSNSLLTLFPAIFSSLFFILAGTDGNVFVKKATAVNKPNPKNSSASIRNRSKRKK